MKGIQEHRGAKPGQAEGKLPLLESAKRGEGSRWDQACGTPAWEEGLQKVTPSGRSNCTSHS